MYAAKHAQVANYWKYFIGQTRGLKRLNVEGKKRAEEAAKLQDQLRIESQATMAANMSRSGRQANLQIAPASGTPQTAGTQTFRRRGAQFAPVGALLGGLNIGSQLSTLNV